MAISTEKEFREWAKSCNWGYLYTHGEQDKKDEKRWRETYITPSGTDVEVCFGENKQSGEIQIHRILPYIWDGG